jgi:tRNA (guanine37-N1)-methyltransferase
MNFQILTLFPEILHGYFANSIMKRSIQNGIITYNLVNIRHFATDRHKTCDDAPYGGGAGMVMKPDPVSRAIESVRSDGSKVIYLSPSGHLFNQGWAQKLSTEKNLILLCGRYEGVDQRVLDKYVDIELCVGNYVLSSGEVAALVVVDAVYRLLEGVISPESLNEESFGENGLLEYPHYTRPEEFQGVRVPEVLLSGNHAAIRAWRRRMRIEKTKVFRPELLWNWEGVKNNGSY